MDDALHCKLLPGGGDRWEVGVHIADVTAFLHHGSELDQVAQERATSVYLVQRVTAAHTDTHTYIQSGALRYTHPFCPTPPAPPTRSSQCYPAFCVSSSAVSTRMR